MSSVEAKRTRRPAARQRDVVLGCIEERISMVAVQDDTDMAAHVTRLYELLDELRRSLGKEESE